MFQLSFFQFNVLCMFLQCCAFGLVRFNKKKKKMCNRCVTFTNVKMLSLSQKCLVVSCQSGYPAINMQCEHDLTCFMETCHCVAKKIRSHFILTTVLGLLHGSKLYRAVATEDTLLSRTNSLYTFSLFVHHHKKIKQQWSK